MSQELRDALYNAKQKLREQEELIRQLTSPPFMLATVIGIVGQSAYLVVEGRVVEQIIPNNLDIQSGQTVRLNEEGGIAAIIDDPITPGSIRTVNSVHEEYCEVNTDSGVSLICRGKIEVEPGDRVVTDHTDSVVIKNLGKIEPANLYTNQTHISWDDIGGLVLAKTEMIEAIEMPHKHPDIYKRYNKTPPKGILLYGPPGCGKTMLGKAAATSLAETYGASASTGFIYVKGPEILNMYVGESEAKIRRLFKTAREHYRKNGYPAVLFIDEADAILGKRGQRVTGINDTTVPMFLSEMDGLDESGAIVLLATNKPDSLDNAVVREGRVDRKIKIDRPDASAAREILRIHIDKVPLTKGTNYTDIVDPLLEEMFSDADITGMMSGAFLAGIVEYASSLAIRRDIKEGSFSGVSIRDLEISLAHIKEQNKESQKQSFI